MPESRFIIASPSKILLLMFSCFFLSFAVEAQSGLIKAMSFEDAEDIAIKSIRRASGIRVKEIKITADTEKTELKKLIKNDKYARNCLSREKLDCILNHDGKCPDPKTPEEATIDFAELNKDLNENCFPLKRLRLTDTLDFLGISDEFRLAALRSYIVRNVEFGVKSVWGFDKKGVAQSFVISGKQLEDVTTSTTVVELAKKIQSAAALPFLSYNSAELIVRNCRDKVEKKIDTPDIAKTVIYDDLSKSDTEVTDFAACIEFSVLKTGDPVIYEKEGKGGKYENEPDKNPARFPENLRRYKYGAQSVRIVNNEGDNKYYYLTKTFQKSLIKEITDNGLIYGKLIENLVESANVSSPKKFVATNIVINSLFKIAASSKNSSTSLIKYSGSLKTFRVGDMLEKLSGSRVSVKNTLASIRVDAAVLTQTIREESDPEKQSAYFLRRGKNLEKIKQVSLTKPLTNNLTIEEVIAVVEREVKL